MIEIVEGKGVGAGKSFFVLTRLVNVFVRGGTAYVSESMVIHFDKLAQYVDEYYGVVLEADQLRSLPAHAIVRLHEHTAPGTEDSPVVIVLDEVQDQLNARDWNDKSKKDFFSWCCQSRHDDNDLIFISQSALNIDKQVKRLATFIWSIRNSCNTPIMGIGRLDSFIKTLTLGLLDGKYFICNRLDQNGKNLMGREWIRHNKRLFACYQSKSMRLSRKRGAAAVARRKLQRSKKGSPRMLKMVIIVCVGALIATGAIIVNRVRGESTPAKEKASKAAAHSITQQLTQAAPTPHKAAYGVERETLKGLWPNGLKTNVELYEKGSLCSKGFVTAVQGNVAKVSTPDGSLVFIVGTGDKSGTVPTAAQAQRILDKKDPFHTIIVPDSKLSEERWPGQETKSVPPTPPAHK